MALFDIFRSRAAIRDLGGLADFVDQNAAFLVQKGMYEYSRARAGHYAKVLFAEPEFHEALDRSRWSAYPLGLAMIGELVEGVLRPSAGADAEAVRSAIADLVLSVFDRYPVRDAQQWQQRRSELAQRMQGLSLHPPKRALEIPEPYARAYFDAMPIHKKLRASEFPTLQAYLQVTLCNIHDELTQRLDAEAVIDSLRAGAR